MKEKKKLPLLLHRLPLCWEAGSWDCVLVEWVAEFLWHHLYSCNHSPPWPNNLCVCVCVCVCVRVCVCVFGKEPPTKSSIKLKHMKKMHFNQNQCAWWALTLTAVAWNVHYLQSNILTVCVCLSGHPEVGVVCFKAEYMCIVLPVTVHATRPRMKSDTSASSPHTHTHTSRLHSRIGQNWNSDAFTV